MVWIIPNTESIDWTSNKYIEKKKRFLSNISSTRTDCAKLQNVHTDKSTDPSFKNISIKEWIVPNLESFDWILSDVN